MLKGHVGTCWCSEKSSFETNVLSAGLSFCPRCLIPARRSFFCTYLFLIGLVYKQKYIFEWQLLFHYFDFFYFLIFLHICSPHISLSIYLFPTISATVSTVFLPLFPFSPSCNYMQIFSFYIYACIQVYKTVHGLETSHCYSSYALPPPKKIPEEENLTYPVHTSLHVWSWKVALVWTPRFLH